MLPIWKDIFYTFSGETFQYYITDGVNTIFSGKAYRFPDDSNGNININRICQNHLNSEIPNSIWENSSGNITLPYAVKTFSLYDSANTLVSAYTFYNDWSYTISASTLSNPVNSKYASGMYCFKTVLNGDSAVTSYSTNGGNGYTVSGCAEYALYYVGIRGGWDSFLIEGKVVEKKDIQQFSYKKDINNNNIERSNTRFQSNINLNWEVNTGWLSDSESQILYDNLLTSNNVYLHNLKTGEIIPVTIQDSAVTNKQFKNERTLINYKISLKSDNNRIRK